MAEGHWDSQKASRMETRTMRASAEVQGDREVKGDRQDRGQEGEEFKDEGAQRRDEGSKGKQWRTEFDEDGGGR